MNDENQQQFEEAKAKFGEMWNKASLALAATPEQHALDEAKRKLEAKPEAKHLEAARDAERAADEALRGYIPDGLLDAANLALAEAKKSHNEAKMDYDLLPEKAAVDRARENLESTQAYVAMMAAHDAYQFFAS